MSYFVSIIKTSPEVLEKYNRFMRTIQDMKSSLQCAGEELSKRSSNRTVIETLLRHKDMLVSYIDNLIFKTFEKYNSATRGIIQQTGEESILYDLFNGYRLEIQGTINEIYHTEMKLFHICLNLVDQNHFDYITKDKQLINKNKKMVHQINNYIIQIEDIFCNTKYIAANQWINRYKDVKRIIDEFKEYYKNGYKFISKLFDKEIYYINPELNNMCYNEIHTFIMNMNEDVSFMELIQNNKKLISKDEEVAMFREVQLRKYTKLINKLVKMSFYNHDMILDSLNVRNSQDPVKYITQCYGLINEYINELVNMKDYKIIPKMNGIELGFIAVHNISNSKVYVKIYNRNKCDFSTICNVKNVGELNIYFNKLLGEDVGCGVKIDKTIKTDLIFLSANEILPNTTLSNEQKSKDLAEVIYYSLVLNLKDLHRDNVIDNHIIDCLYPTGDMMKVIRNGKELYNDAYLAITSLDELNSNLKELLDYYDYNGIDTKRKVKGKYVQSKMPLYYDNKIMLEKILDDNSLSNNLVKMYIYSQSFNITFREIETDPLWYDCYDWDKHCELNNKSTMQLIKSIHDKIQEKLGDKTDPTSQAIIKRNDYFLRLFEGFDQSSVVAVD